MRSLLFPHVVWVEIWVYLAFRVLQLPAKMPLRTSQVCLIRFPLSVFYLLGLDLFDEFIFRQSSGILDTPGFRFVLQFGQRHCLVPLVSTRFGRRSFEKYFENVFPNLRSDFQNLRLESISLCSPNEDFGRLNKRSVVHFLCILQRFVSQLEYSHPRKVHRKGTTDR